MGKKRPEDNRVLKEALELQGELKSINAEIRAIDEAISEIQVQRARCEAQTEHMASPLWRMWYKLFRTPKKHDDDIIIARLVNDQNGGDISLSEPEFIMLRGFKQGILDDLNKRIHELSIEISEN